MGGSRALFWGSVAAWAVALAVSYLLYAREQALEHLLWHLIYGGAAGLFVGAFWHLAKDQVPRGAGLWALGGYAYMIVPDLLWVAPKLWGASPYPHEPWMNVFLGHVFLDGWAHTTTLLFPAAAVGVATWGYVRLRALGQPE